MNERVVRGRWVVLVLAMMPGCFCLDGFPQGPMNGPSDGSVYQYDEPRSECFLETLDLAFVLDAGISNIAPEGTSEVSLSPNGCYRYRRVVQGAC